MNIAAKIAVTAATGYAIVLGLSGWAILLKWAM